MPLRTVSISSRDPIWMTPLVNCMLRRKSRISVFNVHRQWELSKRISDVISDNRKLFLNAKLGGWDWWKNVDVLSQRRRALSISLDDQMILDLNNYFCDLCLDADYIEPTLMEIKEDFEVPQISERQVLIWCALNG